MGSHGVGHDWSALAAAVVDIIVILKELFLNASISKNILHIEIMKAKNTYLILNSVNNNIKPIIFLQKLISLIKMKNDDISRTIKS